MEHIGVHAACGEHIMHLPPRVHGSVPQPTSLHAGVWLYVAEFENAKKVQIGKAV